ncbi:MAG: non-ribosomal peptide synthetase, partial [bacterium]|nr:non-ribosomal peptide synthetase [bacterium]
LSRGGKVAIPGREEVLDMDLLSNFIARNNVTITSCSPLLLNELNKYASEAIRSIRIFISGGDVLKEQHIDKLKQTGKVYNTYGPTETTVCVTYYHCLNTAHPGLSIPIGEPISNYTAYILNESSRLQPVGVPGELCVGGAGVTRGYLNNPGLTAEKFEKKAHRLRLTPESGEPMSCLYHTGDLCRWLEDGNIEFLGRIDQQVKIRGYRIELGEIETRLMKHEKVGACAAVVRVDSDGDRYLCAYIVPGRPVLFAEETNLSMAEELRTFTGRTLPGYMIPSYFIEVEDIPRTASGKVAINALPLPREVFTKEKDFTTPRDQVEKKLAVIWEEVLFGEEGGNASFGIDTNFFEMGGHSLKAITLLAKIKKGFDVNIPLTTLFEIATIRKLAGFMKDAEIDKYESIEPAEKKE